jgi:hypothetical protein
VLLGCAPLVCDVLATDPPVARAAAVVMARLCRSCLPSVWTLPVNFLNEISA